MLRLSMAAFGVGLSAAAPAAPAEDQPLLGPKRDVVVIYQLTGASQQNGAEKLQVSYAVPGRVRLDMFRFVQSPEPFTSLIYDPAANRMVLLPDKQGYVQRDAINSANPGALLDSKMTFTRQGKATIAGVACTDWRVSNGSAAEGTACITDDGVVLRATRSKPVAGTMEAIAVKYGQPPAKAFEPPADYKMIPAPAPQKR